MKAAVLFLLLSFSTLFSTAAIAAEKSPAQVAQAFYDAYYKVVEKNPRKFPATSPDLSKGFKAAYASLLKKAGTELDWDPILAGNDYPDSGYKATQTIANSDAAMVVMTSRDANFEGTILVQVIKVDDRWVINGINNLVGESLSAGY